MGNEKIFKTKTGFCHILPDKIVLTRNGIVGNISEVSTGNNIYRILFIYSAISLGLLYLAFKSYQNGEIIFPVSFCLISLFLIFNILTSINNSATPIIYKNKIKDVKFRKGVRGLTRPRFEILFENENGKIKKRLIMLPCSLNKDQEEDVKKALEIMINEKLINHSY